MDKVILNEKLQQAVQLLNEQNIDMWLIFVRESSVNHDPALDIVVGANVTWHSAFIIEKTGESTAIIGSLDFENIQEKSPFQYIITYVSSFEEKFVPLLQEKSPKNIAINYSLDSNIADGLSHGMYITLEKHIKDSGITTELVSAEHIIAALKGRKSPSEIANMKLAIAEAEKIFDSVTEFLKNDDISEQDVANFVLGKVQAVGLELAWDPDHCPAVYSGPENAGAHSSPTTNKVLKGHIINMDFGVKVNNYCSDLQRTWYSLKEGESEAPPEVKQGFAVLREAIDKAAATLKPGVRGVDVDTAARTRITENGYGEYKHGLGHQVGTNVHDGGVGLYPAWPRYGNLPMRLIEKDLVFTIEPRLFVENFGTVTVEEMYVVTETGCSPISQQQKELWLVSRG